MPEKKFNRKRSSRMNGKLGFLGNFNGICCFNIGLLRYCLKSVISKRLKNFSFVLRRDFHSRHSTLYRVICSKNIQRFLSEKKFGKTQLISKPRKSSEACFQNYFPHVTLIRLLFSCLLF